MAGDFEVNILSNVSVRSTKSIRQSESYLANKHNYLNLFTSIDDLVTDETQLSEVDRTAIEHHILNLRAAIAREIWSREIYVGRSILDDCVLNAVKAGGGNIVGKVVTDLAHMGAERPGFVLYPLTSFGFKRPKLFDRSSSLRDWVAFPQSGYALSGQQHSVKDAYERLNKMSRSLGIKQKIDFEDVRHFANHATWLAKNPLMLVRLASHTGSMYENQFVYSLKIRTAASYLLMLHALSVEMNGPVERFESTSSVSNWETLDIRHYLIGENLPSRPMSLRRVPMNVSALELARLSDVAAVISTDELSTPRMRRISSAIMPALKTVEQGYFRHVNLSSKDKVQKRLYQRLVTALDWYRQSFGSRINKSEAIVAIAVAFETLLTDNYQRGIADRIGRRIGLCLKGVPGVESYKQAVITLYDARSEIVHNGALSQQANLVAAQAAFARCFYRLISRLDGWTPVVNEPIRDILQDN
ncbi:hypothetical protein A8A54_15405 [Brucella pseudogrignonensis]|uniref:HEPN domain-containing protein n=1 Tax=Brucella pseudogrignonensis TaxID=419475 RepID=UPI0007DA9E5A|nr:HEPN domain-containing protein [Brucella pseudogrignonensis]ANG98556.1 hypothetical protein A8A54_15405 [Brucella pseudogrignonensis]